MAQLQIWQSASPENWFSIGDTCLVL